MRTDVEQSPTWPEHTKWSEELGGRFKVETLEQAQPL